MKQRSVILLGWMLCFATPAAWAQPASILEIPFEMEHNQILLPVWINGSGPYRMILDTGVTPSVIHLATARAAQIEVGASPVGNASGGGGDPVPIYLAPLINLELGKQAFGDVLAVAMDMSKLADRLGGSLDGVLGYSFLKDRVVQIDYPARKVRLYLDGQWPPPAQPEDPDRFLERPLEFVEGDIIPLLKDFQINGKVAPVSLDTGSSHTLEIYPRAVGELALQEERAQAKDTTSVGARGEHTIWMGRVDALGIGSLIRYDQEIVFPDPPGDNTEHSGNLGNGYLQHYVLTLDYRRKRLRLERITSSE